MSFDGHGRRLLEHVAQSPRLCAAHDRAGWLALFADDAEINDPVGSAPHVGRAALGRFYDTFIAPNALRFDVEHDIVDGMTVMRDLTLTSTMASGLAIPVPMHLRYDLVEQDGALRIRRLCAHWELPVLLRAQLASARGWLTSLQLTPQLLRHQGLGGLLGFMRGLRSVGAAGKAAAERELGARGIPCRKLLAAGDYVTATIEAAGRRGVAVLRFAADGRSIEATELLGVEPEPPARP